MTCRKVFRTVVVGALFAATFNVRALIAAAEAEPAAKSFTVYPIGTVHKQNATTTIEI